MVSTRRVMMVSGVIAGVVLAGGVSAWANQGPPPKAQASVRYDRARGITACRQGTPTSLAFEFRYTPQQLEKSYQVKLEAIFLAKSGSVDVKEPELTIAKNVGPSWAGTYFRIPKSAKPGTPYTVIVSSAGGSEYDFIALNGRVSCQHHRTPPLIPPTPKLSKVSCHGDATLTIDNVHGSEPWYFAFYGPHLYFGPSSFPVKVGHKRVFHLTHMVAGGRVEFNVQSKGGALSLGTYLLRDGCSP